MNKENFNNNKESYENKEVVKHYTTLAQKGLLNYEKKIFSDFLKKGMRVLDVGCGAGRTTKPLNDMGMNVTGIDISRAMIKTAKRVYPDVDFRVADVTNLGDFNAGEFDCAIFSYNGFILLKPDEKEKALAQINRVLVKDGLFIFTSTPIDIKYAIFIAYERNLNLRNYKDRLKVGTTKFFDNGSDVDLYIPFDEDIRQMLENAIFECVLSQNSHSMVDVIEKGLNDTIVWVAKKIK